ncbi:class A beta-lactamase [Algoriphagus formosus]|uniref:class A beta-lactamase n=1 Tax=Algoriphagus formosus TaxID=2007308 RepID=UPI000C2858DB|nr:class A beta-lactamase [Algoriphagus formosus]
MKRNLKLLFTLIISALFAVQPAFAQKQNVEALSKKIENLTEKLAGRIGVAAQEIGSKETITINGDEQFVMASTYKVAIAAAVLDRVDRGELRLDQMVDVTLDMMMIGDAALNGRFVHPGIQLSIANLIEVMITESDNTATDISMGLAGGPAAVTNYLRRIGISDFRVDRSTGEIIGEFYGLPGPATHKLATEVFKARPELLKIQSDRNLDFEADPRDQATPFAMLQLLLAIDGGKATSSESRDFLINVMSRTRTGSGRLKGLLPKGTPVANKTGTIGGVANDVGYITLPDGRRFAIVVFTKSSTTSEADRDRAIAEVTRTLYDFYYLKP